MENLPQKGLTADAPHGRDPAVAVVVVGASAGGVHALGVLLSALPGDFAAPVVVVQHRSPGYDTSFLDIYRTSCPLALVEAEDKDELAPGTVYFAPANYHLLLERGGSLALSTDEKVHFSRPSIDVLFASAAEAYGPLAAGVVLTGASCDGAAGLAAIKAHGGLALVQDPATAEYPVMPRAALGAAAADHVLPLERLGPELARLVNGPAEAMGGRRG